MDLLTDDRHSSGYLFVKPALACGDEAAAIRTELARCPTPGQSARHKWLERAKREGDLPRNLDHIGLARVYLPTELGNRELGLTHATLPPTMLTA